jgi:HK97 family phage major capsid protein
MANPVTDRVRQNLVTLATTEAAILRDAHAEGRSLKPRDEARLADLRAEREESEQILAKLVRDEEREARAAEVRVPTTPDRGRHGSPWSGTGRSFVRDLIAARSGDSHAQALIATHDDIARDRILAEGRSLITSSSAGAFVPDIYAPGDAFPGTGSPFWDWLAPMQLPEGGEVKQPRFDAAFTGGVQTAEGSAISSSTPAITDATSPVRTFGASTIISYQSLDFGGEDYDRALFEGLGNAYSQALEVAALNGGGTGTLKGALAYGTADGSHVINLPGTATPTGPEFVEALAEAVSTVIDSVYETDLAIFMHPRRLGYLQALVDEDKRPYLAPFSPGVGREAEDVRGYGSVRAQLRFGGYPVYTSGGIGTSYATAENEDRVLVIARGALKAWQAAAGPRRITVDPDGSTMRYRLTAFNYVAMLAARPEGIAQIRGNLTAPFA